MNAIQEIKSQALAFEAKHRVIPKTIAAVSAAQLAMVSVSAETGGSGSTVDISTVTDSMTSSLVDLAGKVGIACAGVVGAGLTIFAMRWAVGKVMGFFKAIGK
jgi:hypothetical protein